VKLRCLLVDDSEEFLASAARLLESQGLEIVGHATSGDEALQLAVALRPEVALVDIELGDEDGIALISELEQQAPDTRVILISAYERDDLSDLIPDSGAAGFIPKRALGSEAIADVLRGRPER
jgi:two-component system nitrate/nitrite response regulator NarL